MALVGGFAARDDPEGPWAYAEVADYAGGDPDMHLQDGVNGVLPEDAAVCAERIVELLRDGRSARDIGKTARATVRDRFLLPRLLRDDLQPYDELLRA